MSSVDFQTLPPAMQSARGAARALAALLRIADPAGARSLGGPDTADLADLVDVVTGKFDEGLGDLGFSPHPSD
ncbi:hypothetical protein [Caulobacter hibisci]|uniref:Uncharacterized protein n=1 Tax=Caulobacter hibisci TaxID=2035993 RepID=A0ABS0SXS7_9CAUL|nr:hypothetical protein [Caulobacter hibisci]MBI1684425.1 hypothetical protein [Caulobacter hibisci]